MGIPFAALALAAVTAAASNPVLAQTTPDQAPYQVKAREVYARIIGFRTAAGEHQTAAMATWLGDVLKAGGVPAEDIATVQAGGATAMIVRLPGSTPARPILF